MIPLVFQLEMHLIDAMSRSQLQQELRARQDCLPLDCRELLEGQPTDRLRLLVLAVRVIHTVRHLRIQDPLGIAVPIWP